MSEQLAQTMQDTIMSAFESQMNNVHTAIPCVVVAVRDGLNGQMVDIQPTINQKFKDGTVQERPPVYGVPVSFPVSSTAGFTFPVKVGDTGMAIYSMRNMEAWKNGNGMPGTPANQGKMDKSDAVFYPGVQPQGMAVNNPAKHVLAHNTSDAVLFQNLGGIESEVRLKADGSIEVNTSNRPVVVNCSTATVIANDAINLNSPQMTVNVGQTNWLGEINIQGNIVQTGNYTQSGIYILEGVTVNGHTHPGVMAGPSNTGPMV